MLTQLISESSITFKHTILGSLDAVQASALPHGKLGLKHPVWLGEAGKDINACDGSLCQLESPCLILVLWVQEKELSNPCLNLFHFPQFMPFTNLGNTSSPLENISNLIHATVASRAEKLVQTHSVPLEVSIRVYTHTQVMYYCLLLLKTKIFKPHLSGKMRVILVQDLSLCLELLFCDGRYISIEGMHPKIGVKIRMSHIKTCIL